MYITNTAVQSTFVGGSFDCQCHPNTSNKVSFCIWLIFKLPHAVKSPVLNLSKSNLLSGIFGNVPFGFKTNKQKPNKQNTTPPRPKEPVTEQKGNIYLTATSNLADSSPTEGNGCNSVSSVQGHQGDVSKNCFDGQDTNLWIILFWASDKRCYCHPQGFKIF